MPQWLIFAGLCLSFCSAGLCRSVRDELRMATPLHWLRMLLLVCLFLLASHPFILSVFKSVYSNLYCRWELFFGQFSPPSVKTRLYCSCWLCQSRISACGILLVHQYICFKVLNKMKEKGCIKNEFMFHQSANTCG